MEFDYIGEKAKLKKKVITFLSASAIFIILFLAGLGESGTLNCIFFGFIMGLVFYIPGRIREYYSMSWVMTIILAVVFVLALFWLNDKIGSIVFVVVLAPFADIGYSIYRINKAGKN